jgi:hypothetical protein
MTTLDIFIKIFADFSGKTETDLQQWIQTNISGEVLETLCEPISDDDAEALFREYKENPLAIIKTISTVFTVKNKPDQP